MRGPDHVRIRHIVTVALGGALAVASAPGVSIAAAEDVATLPRCAGLEVSGTVDPDSASPWQTELDGDGAVIGHHLTLRRGGREQRLRTGRRGFMVRVGTDRLLIGERADGSTRLDMIDNTRACRLWTRQSELLLYPERDKASGTVSLTAHDRDSRRYEGTHVLDAETGETQVVIQADVCRELPAQRRQRRYRSAAAGRCAQAHTQLRRWCLAQGEGADVPLEVGRGASSMGPEPAAERCR